MTIETLKSPNARNRNRLYFRGKIEIFIRLFDEHFACHFESHWRETWRHTGRRTVPQISLETPSPHGRALLIKSIYVSLDGNQFLYSLVRFPPVHSLFIYSICLFIYIIIIFSPKLRNMEFFFLIDWNISETWTRIKFKKLSKLLLGSLSEKKCIVFKGKKLLLFFFSVK